MKFKWEGGGAYDVKFEHEEVEVHHEGKVSRRPSCTATLMIWDKVLGWRECFSDTVTQYHKDRVSKVLAEKYAFLKLIRNTSHPWRKVVVYLHPESEEDLLVGYNVPVFAEFQAQAFRAFFTPKKRRIISAEGRRKK